MENIIPDELGKKSSLNGFMEITLPNQKIDTTPTSFEDAISATGYGKYNFMLMVLIIPSLFAVLYETSTMSFVFPVAQCDLDLTLNDKGVLNAVAYLGMISSAFVWGFLADTLGRKKILVLCYLLDGLFNFVCSLSQNFTTLVTFKFLGGFMTSGAYSTLISYILEFYCAKYRVKQQLIFGFIIGAGCIILPILGIAIFPTETNLYFFDGLVELHSWNLFIFACTIPAIISGLAFCFMPESPKFLMTVGRNEEALIVFKTIYSWNTGNSKDSFPVKILINERPHNVSENGMKIPSLKEGLLQMRPLFFKPHLSNILLLSFLLMISMMSINTLRLWMPQIFQVINDYQFYNNESNYDLCNILKLIQPPSENATDCNIVTDIAVYTNTIIVEACCMISFIFAGYLINKLGKNIWLCILGLSSGICWASMYFANNTATVVILSSMFLSLTSIPTYIIIAVIVDLFPTTLRATALSAAMAFGRLGVVFGNLLFPVYLSLGCVYPFAILAAIQIVTGGVSLLLSNTEMKSLT